MASLPKTAAQMRSASAECVRVLRRHPLATAATLVAVALAAALPSPSRRSPGNHAASQHATPDVPDEGARGRKAQRASRPDTCTARQGHDRQRRFDRRPTPRLRPPRSRAASASGGAGTTRRSAASRRSAPKRSSSTTGQGAESFLVVDRHHGKHTWRWRLDTTYTPRVTRGGVVGFFDRRNLATAVDPVRPDPRRREARRHAGRPRRSTVRVGKSWWLELRLDDRKLRAAVHDRPRSPQDRRRRHRGDDHGRGHETQRRRPGRCGWPRTSSSSTSPRRSDVGSRPAPRAGTSASSRAARRRASHRDARRDHVLEKGDRRRSRRRRSSSRARAASRRPR